MIGPLDLTFWPYIERNWSFWHGIPRQEDFSETWLWLPGERLSFARDLETLDHLIAAGWERMEPETHMSKARSQYLRMFSQLRDVRLVGKEGEDHELWARSEDVRECGATPVTLAFTLHDFAAEADIMRTPGTKQETLALAIAQMLPPPQFGEVALIDVERDGQPGWQLYSLKQLDASGRKLWRRMANALLDLAEPAEWWAIDNDLLGEINAGTGRYAAMREASARAKADPAAWLEKWGEIQMMARDLAEAYWKAHHGNVRKLPVIPNIFNADSLVKIPSVMTVPHILEGYSAGGTESGGWGEAPPPETSRVMVPTFRRTTDDYDTTMQVRPENPDRPLTDEVVAQLWKQVRRYTDLDGDVFLAMLAQYMAAEKDEDGYVWITSGRILDYRGVVPIMKREDDGQFRRAGHRQEDGRAVAECVGGQGTVWIIVGSWIVEESERRRGRAAKRKRITHESKLTEIVEVIRQKDLGLTDEGQEPAMAIAWRYRIGTWLTKLLDEPNNRYMAWLCQQALKYDPYHETWEKRLARYFMFHLRINAAKQSHSIKRGVGKLIRELSLSVDDRHPERTRRRFEQALTQLAADGIIDGWAYEADNPPLPARKWLETWLDQWSIRVTASSLISARHNEIAERKQAHMAKAQTLRQPREMREQEKQQGEGDE